LSRVGGLEHLARALSDLKARRTSWNKTETKHWNCFSFISIFFNRRINMLTRLKQS